MTFLTKLAVVTIVLGIFVAGCIDPLHNDAPVGYACVLILVLIICMPAIIENWIIDSRRKKEEFNNMFNN